MNKTEQAHAAGQHETNPKRRCKLCWKVASDAQKKISELSSTDLWTLKLTMDEGYRTSYLPSLRRCVDARLVIFRNNGRGAPILTDAGRERLARFNATQEVTQ